MNQEPNSNEVSELVESLQGSLNAPNPAAIRAGVDQRAASRRRAYTVGGVFVAVAVIVGGLFALNGDRTTTTETASGDATLVDGPDTDGVPSSDETVPPTIQTTPPTELSSTTAEPSPTTTASPTVETATVNIADCVNNSTTFAEGSRWIATSLPPVWEGLGTIEVDIVIDGDILIATDDSGFAGTFRLDRGLASPAVCTPFAEPTPTTEVPVTTTTVPPSTTIPAITLTPATAIIADCVNSSRILLDGDTWVGVDLPAAWKGQDTVEVAVLISGDSLTATDAQGRSGTFRLDRGLATEAICKLWDEPIEPPVTTTAPPQTTVPPETSTTEPETGGVTPVGPFDATVNVAICSNNSTINLDGQEWIATSSGLPAEWEGQGTVEVTVIIRDNTATATDAAGRTGAFGRNFPDLARSGVCVPYGPA